MVESDEKLIENWKMRHDLSSYKELRHRNKNMVYQTIHRYSSTSIPRAALESECWSLFDDAVNSYNPNAGAKFSTHLNYQLRKIDRYVKKNQNTARIPEAIAGKIGDYDRSNALLSEKFQRVPTNKELAQHSKIPLKHIKQIQTSRRSDLFEGLQVDELASATGSNVNWVLQDLRGELNDQEKIVFDHLTGMNNKKKYTNKKLLAQQLSISPGRLSQITNSISKKIEAPLKKHL
jgi:DNA-directed RNA polymerase sigma subunit (sigma70/sigma32)